MHFALIRETPLVTEKDLFWLARVLEQQAREFCLDWHLPEAAIDVIDARTHLPDFCQPVVFVDDDSDPDALAIHYVDYPRLQPAARVYVPRASGFNSGPQAVTAAASHEVLEALADPWCDKWRAHPDPARSGVLIALEVADPVQDEYAMAGHEGDWLVSNYVTPSYFDESLWDDENRKRFLAAGGKFDRLGELFLPGRRLPGGYQILSDGMGVVWQEFGDEAVSKPGADHAWARTVRRLAVTKAFFKPSVDGAVG